MSTRHKVQYMFRVLAPTYGSVSAVVHNNYSVLHCRVAGKLKGLGLLPPSAVGLHLSKSPTFNKRQEPHNVTLQNVKGCLGLSFYFEML